MAVLWRGELWELGWGTVEGQEAYPFGLITRAELPDPSFEWQPHYGPGIGSNRNFFQMMRGRWTMSGSFPDIILLDGRLLKFPIGSVWCDSNPRFMIDQITLPELFVRADYYTVSDNYSCNTPDGTTFNMGRRFGHGKVNRATISAEAGEALRLSLDEVIFTKYKQGGINDETTGGGDTPSGNNTWDASLSSAGSGMSVSRTNLEAAQPYFFSYGTIEMLGEPIAEITSLRITVNNNIEAKYYINSTKADGVMDNSRRPKELREGRREYEITLSVDVKDATMFNHLMAEGYYSSSKLSGLSFDTWFCRDSNTIDASSDYIRIMSPASVDGGGNPALSGLPNSQGVFIRRAPHNITEANMTNVTIEAIARSLRVVVKDPYVSVYP
jgi:hypothetical protein